MKGPAWHLHSQPDAQPDTRGSSALTGCSAPGSAMSPGQSRGDACLGSGDGVTRTGVGVPNLGAAAAAGDLGPREGDPCPQGQHQSRGPFPGLSLLWGCIDELWPRGCQAGTVPSHKNPSPLPPGMTVTSDAESRWGEGEITESLFQSLLRPLTGACFIPTGGTNLTQPGVAPTPTRPGSTGPGTIKPALETGSWCPGARAGWGGRGQ